MHINQLKPFVDSDSLPCHKVLTVLDQQANQEDDPLIPDQYKGQDLSDTMKSELDNVLSWFPSVFSNKPSNTISIKTTTTTQSDLQLTLSQFILRQISRKNWTTCWKMA